MNGFGIYKGMLQRAWLLARRELRDQMRDWRILVPIIILTLFFPVLMNFTAREAVDFVNEYGATMIADRMLPFLLMVVGFFPVSISLVIALESFAGERERKTLEPLLATPFSDIELYLGKMIASLFIPLLAAYLGISVYLTALITFQGWDPPFILILQMLIMTTVQALVMVSGAVVISSQVTSVRGANLLASFIIVPVSQLVIVESLLMFWGQYAVMWWLIIALFILAILLSRAGLFLFNRENLLGREIDVLNIRWSAGYFWNTFSQGGPSIRGWYRSVIYETVMKLRMPASAVALMFAAAVMVGLRYADIFPLPADLLVLDDFEAGFFDNLAVAGLIGGRGWIWILWNNVRAVGLSALAGFLSFGIGGLLLLMIPVAILGYLVGLISTAGEGWLLFIVGLVLPHGLLEIPAILLAGAALLRVVAAVMSPTDGKSIGEVWVFELAEWTRVIVGIILPMIILAAGIESMLTPRLAMLLF